MAANKLLRALTYTNLDTAAHSPQNSVTILISDSADMDDSAYVYAADRILGDGADNVIEIDSANISTGDEIDGGDGQDTLKLSGGFCDLVFISKIEGIETIQGSDGGDSIFMFSSQVAKVKKIDGGGQENDYLHIQGNAIDLRGKILTGFKAVFCEGIDTTIIVDNVATAKMFDGQLADREKLTITSGALSDTDRLALHKRGIDNITHNGRTTGLADIVGKAFTGSSRKNALLGKMGNDTLDGGSGNDTLTGGVGNDTFVFKSKLGTYKTDRSVNFDLVTDFNVADDTIRLENRIFKSLKSTGILNKSFFKIGTKPGDKNDYIVYSKTTGILSYDPDGSHSKYKAIEFTKLDRYLALTASDFRIV